MHDDSSTPESPGGATAVEAVALPTVMVAGDEASHLEAQLEAIQEVTVRSEREAAAAKASCAEAQAQHLGKFLVRFPVHPFEDFLS